MKLLTLCLVLMVISSMCSNLTNKISKDALDMLKFSVYTEGGDRAETQAVAGQTGSTKQLPTDGVQENERNPFDPRPRDINAKFLKQHLLNLGGMFDPDYMSVEDPRNQAINSKAIQYRTKGRLPKFLNLLRRARVQGGLKIRPNITKKNWFKFEKSLQLYTACPLKHSWKFLGDRFWPSWIKEGSCVSERSCSIPSGMMCKESHHMNKLILRWKCGDSSQSCKWRVYRYRITTNCGCTC